MKFYFAPLEGVTGYLYRGVHHRLFGLPEIYYAPFVSARQTHQFDTKERKDLDPANNQGYSLVPQVMASQVEPFVWAAQEIHAMGYPVVNLNLGCPMPTIVTRHRGSGMLADLCSLEAFLDGIFDGVANGGPRISIKTRLGLENLDNACAIMELYNHYPVAELIVHPRCQKDLYKVPVHPDIFEECMKVTRHPVCYNGDIFSKDQYILWRERFSEDKFPQIGAVMLGRGLIANPALCREILGGKKASKAELKGYHDALLEVYLSQNLGFSTVLHRMKELWFYLGYMFMDSEKRIHKIRISKTYEEYLRAVNLLFQNTRVAENGAFGLSAC